VGENTKWDLYFTARRENLGAISFKTERSSCKAKGIHSAGGARGEVQPVKDGRKRKICDPWTRVADFILRGGGWRLLLVRFGLGTNGGGGGALVRAKNAYQAILSQF